MADNNTINYVSSDSASASDDISPRMHVMTPEEIERAMALDKQRRRSPKFLAKRFFGWFFGSLIVPLILLLMCLSMFWRIIG